MMREPMLGPSFQPEPPDAGAAGDFGDAMHAHHADGPARRAALVLHALPLVDRDWLLQQLPTSHREQLSSLLTELAELGIPASAAMLGDDSPRTPVQQASVTEGRPSSAESRLDAADPKELARLLEREPAAIAVRLLILREWPWARDVLKRLSPGRRRQIEIQLQSRADRTGCGRAIGLLDTRLLALLEERLAVGSADSSVNAGFARRPSPRWRLGSRSIEPLVWLQRLGKGARARLDAAASRAVQ